MYTTAWASSKAVDELLKLLLVIKAGESLKTVIAHFSRAHILRVHVTLVQPHPLVYVKQCFRPIVSFAKHHVE